MTTVAEGQKVTITAEISTRNPTALANLKVIEAFFASYLIDKAGFYGLWVDDEPQVITPFVTDGVAVCKSAVRTGWAEIRTFWDPIHDGMKGKFNWIIDDVMVGEDPNLIITKSSSDIDVKTSEIWGGKPLKYQGRYVQIFKFEDGRVKSFEEYYDTALLNAAYA